MGFFTRNGALRIEWRFRLYGDFILLLTMFQSTLIVIQRVSIILQCKLFAPRHEVITVNSHERTCFADCHLLAFVNNHNRPSSFKQKSIAACLLIFLRNAHDSTRL